MGNARYDDRSWNAYSAQTSRKSREQIFTQRQMHPDLDPSKFHYREAVDSSANPQTTPIILAADETGSMGILAETIIKSGLGTIMKELYARRPVTDPQICCVGVGDITCDSAPCQVTQFEADTDALAPQIEKIWLEGNGGGNNGESYPIVWVFAALKTKVDSWDKRKKKGYIFTIGDEQPHTSSFERDQLRHFLGVDLREGLATERALKMAQEKWNVFHLIVKPVPDQPVVSTWKGLLGERAIHVPDIERLAAGIVSTIQVVEGHDPATVAGSWKHGDAIQAEAVVHQLTGGV